MKTLTALMTLSVFGMIVGFYQPALLRAHPSDATTVSLSSSAQPAFATEEAQTYLGKIVQTRTEDGKNLFVLQESASQNLLMLDDQTKAKQFEGKDVKVTGTFDTASKTIRVVDIQAAA